MVEMKKHKTVLLPDSLLGVLLGDLDALQFDLQWIIGVPGADLNMTNDRLHYDNIDVTFGEAHDHEIDDSCGHQKLINTVFFCHHLDDCPPEQC